ncbi:MAG: hypothetical protein M1550_04010 [Deltaproteobacteria bacterium]|nr:hypothetical protein [Deltaproteobacteria bacterium]
MAHVGFQGFGLTAADLDFLTSVVAPDAHDRDRLKRILHEDEDFRNSFIEDDRVLGRVIADKEVFLKISPRLYFEILLRRVRKELEGASHTIEHGGVHKIAVFDAGKVVDLLSKRDVVLYLADMLSSFTRVESYSISYRVRQGVWGKIRFNDADVDSLLRLLEFAGEEYRPHCYKRIADICLFLLGVFPESIRWASRCTLAGEPRPRFIGWAGRSAEEYEEEGRKYYRLAAEHPASRSWDLSEVFQLLHDSFRVARKPLTLLAENYIQQRRRSLFEA